MESIHTIARAQPATPVQTVNTKSTSVTQAHAKMEVLVRTTITTTHATVHTDSPEKIARNMWIGVHKIHVKMAHHVHNTKTLTNVTVYLDGLENCVTLKWCHAKMLPFAKM